MIYAGYLFTFLPIIYLIFIIGLVFLFFKIFDGIRKSNIERNEILGDIYEELKRQNSAKDQNLQP